jgi:hypothetical protein
MTQRLRRERLRVITTAGPLVNILTVQGLIEAYQWVWEEPVGRVDVTRVQQMLNALGYKPCGPGRQQWLLEQNYWMARLYEQKVLVWVSIRGGWQQLLQLSAVNWRQAIGEGALSLTHYYELRQSDLHRRSLLCRDSRILMMRPERGL